ncbi:MAG: Hsp20 family protein [Candidatus Omnitrophica bacterium]|nr:Hsp20 family protein [Candidatus Omnitrophota bacterium]
MSKKVLMGIIAVLAVALILQTGYLIGRGSAERKYKERISKLSRARDPRTPLVKRPTAGQPRSRRSSGSADYWDAWGPFEEMDRMQRVMNRMFNDSFGKASRIDSDSFGGVGARFDPAIDVKERGDAYVLIVDLPGVDKDTININAQPNSVTISGERSIETQQEDSTKGFYRAERSFGSFTRTVPLARRIKPDQVTAEANEGVLLINLPKEEGSVKGTGKGTSIRIQ